ncbi:MAG: peroxiredoxin family protein [Armatimonadota bacterium]
MMYRVQTIGTIEEVIAPSFTLPSARDGTPISLYAFRQRQPVGLVFVPQTTDIPAVLDGVRLWQEAFRNAGAALLVIAREPASDISPILIVLVDRGGDVFRRYECTETLCLFGLDRYGAVVYRSACEVAKLESALRQLLDAIEFSEMQCPE